MLGLYIGSAGRAAPGRVRLGRGRTDHSRL